jgi:hypothetical protein
MAQNQDAPEIARFYTRSRRFPKVLGRLHDGTKIPGGPYTLTQALVGVVVGAIALTTRAQWGTGTILVDVPLALGITWAAAWGAGRIPATRRNLLGVVIGGLSAMMRPFEGKYREKTLRWRPPHFAAGTAEISSAAPAREQPQAPARTAAIAKAVPVISIPAPRPITAVERLLQQSQSK